MTSQLDEQLLVRYLLGEATDQEQQELEEHYFGDDAYFDRLLIVEEDLIDSYVSGGMNRAERKRFEQHFLSSPERRQRVAFAQALHRKAQRTELTTRPVIAAPTESLWGAWATFWRVPQVAALAGVAVLVIVGSWSVTQTYRLRDQIAGLRAEETILRSDGLKVQNELEQQRIAGQQLDKALQEERTARRGLEENTRNPLRIIASFILAPGSVRSSDASRPLLVRTGTDTIQLQLDLANDDDHQYRVHIRTADDQEIWSQDLLRSRPAAAGRAVTVSLPATLLVSGDYVVTLQSVTSRGDIEEAGQYSFRIAKR